MEQEEVVVATPAIRPSWQPRPLNKFLACGDGEDVCDKAARRALQLRTHKRSELISKSRSKMRTNAETTPTMNDATHGKLPVSGA
jgi:hypothetical protein